MEVDRAGLEGFEGDLALAVIFEAQALEVVGAHVDRQVLAPIIGVELELDVAPLLEGLDAIRAGAERRLERRGVEVAALPPVLRKHRHADDDEMGVARALLDEAHQHDVVSLGGDALDLAQQLRVGRMRLLLERVEGEGDVRRGHLRAVGKARLGPEQEAVAELVRGIAHRAGEQPVDRVRLVAVAGHQRVEGRRHARRAVALLGIDVHGVERVEVLVAGRRRDLERQHAAFRSVRIHIGEVLEVRRQREIPERGEAVRLDVVVREGAGKAQHAARDEARGRQFDRAASCQCEAHEACFPV